MWALHSLTPFEVPTVIWLKHLNQDYVVFQEEGHCTSLLLKEDHFAVLNANFRACFCNHGYSLKIDTHFQKGIFPSSYQVGEDIALYPKKNMLGVGLISKSFSTFF